MVLQSSSVLSGRININIKSPVMQLAAQAQVSSLTTVQGWLPGPTDAEIIRARPIPWVRGFLGVSAILQSPSRLYPFLHLGFLGGMANLAGENDDRSRSGIGLRSTDGHD